MDSDKKTLFDRCHVNTNEDGDTFVGVKADSDNVVVYFPLGYQLPKDEYTLKKDIQCLFRILSRFTVKEDKLIHLKKHEAPQTVNFPIKAYLDIIEYYLSTGNYYYEKEVQYELGGHGRTDWGKTLKKVVPLVQGRSFIYTKNVARVNNPKDNNFITELNKVCVYESFEKLGWLYGGLTTQKTTFTFDTKQAIAILDLKIHQVNDQKIKDLFNAMKAMIKYMDERTVDKQFFFCTNRFEYVWQAMIDKVFGIADKDRYFPRAKWVVRQGTDKGIPRHTLEPDSIMLIGKKYYVIDAKYYRYGATGRIDHLPNSADINKQITYGEYIKNTSDPGNENLFNAFLMPFNQMNNIFGFNEFMGNIGEATGDWRNPPLENFEKIQGVVIDVRYLMYHLEGNHDVEKQKLAEVIEAGCKKK